MDRVDAYRAMVEEIFGMIPPEAGYGIDELRQAEERLGIQVPGELAAFLRASGRYEPLAGSFNRLLAPDELGVSGSKLVFAEENQAVVFWAADLAGHQDDPEVCQAANCDQLEWFSEEVRCSEFFRIFALWQAVNGGLPHGAVCGNAPTSVQGVCSDRMRLLIEHQDLCVYRHQQGYVALLASPDELGVNVGAHEPSAVQAIGAELGLSWDWSSLEEAR